MPWRGLARPVPLPLTSFPAVQPARHQPVSTPLTLRQLSHDTPMDQLASKLTQDLSPYALCRGNPLQLQLLCTRAQSTVAKAYNYKTLKRDIPYFVKWTRYCRILGTTPWRDDADANSGVDRIGHQREIVLFVNALIHFSQSITPRPAGSSRTACKPQSAMNVLLAVRRVFKRNLLVLLDWKQVNMALKGLCKDFLIKHGPRSLIPK